MKNLIDILNESVFDIDDEQIVNKTTVDLDFNISDMSKKYLDKLGYFTINDLQTLITDIRDNNVGVDEKFYAPIKKYMYQLHWQVYIIRYSNQNVIQILISRKQGSKPITNIGPIILWEKRPYHMLRNPEIRIEARSIFKTQLREYLAVAIDKIHQSTDKKYKNFNNFIR